MQGFCGQDGALGTALALPCANYMIVTLQVVQSVALSGLDPCFLDKNLVIGYYIISATAKPQLNDDSAVTPEE